MNVTGKMLKRVKSKGMSEADEKKITDMGVSDGEYGANG